MDTQTELPSELDEEKTLAIKVYWLDSDDKKLASPAVLGISRETLEKIPTAKVEDILAQLFLIYRIPGSPSRIIPGTVNFQTPVKALREIKSFAVIIDKEK